MKKTKILLPAMGLIAFATAASVVGSVAWFTASQAYQMTAGEFAVVNTKDNLEAELGDGVATTVDNSQKKVTTNSANAVLTDASFDHVNKKFVEPDDKGETIEEIIALNDASLDTKLVRDDSGTPVIYTAFTWDITFKLSMKRSATHNVGLFFDLSSDKSYMHEAYIAKGDEVAEENQWYAEPLCDAEHVVAQGTTLTLNGKYYKKTPDDTGKGFRVAIVPTDIPTGSMGYAKVWGKNNSSANGEVMRYIDTTSPVAAGDDLTPTNVGAAYAIDHSVSLGKPAEAIATSEAAGTVNCLGYFHPGAGETVELKYTCIAFFEGTDSSIVNTATTVYETMVVGMDFTVDEFNA